LPWIEIRLDVLVHREPAALITAEPDRRRSTASQESDKGYSGRAIHDRELNDADKSGDSRNSGGLNGAANENISASRGQQYQGNDEEYR
jgi:hypothetical protein